MKAVILAGGMGTRISEETAVRPKPMIEIGGMPILWHIMKLYGAHGIEEFVICLGYKGYVIKEFFANYHLHSCDVTFDMAANRMEVHASRTEPWRVTLIDTGEATMTGGRLKRALPHVDGEAFCLTYGDAVTDLDITAVIDFHRAEGREATLTAVRPPGRFGALETDGTAVRGFHEKPAAHAGWVSGGFFVLSPAVGERLHGDDTVWEAEPLEGLARDGQLSAYRHDGFWYTMDTLHERNHLQELWASGRAPWKTWE